MKRKLMMLIPLFLVFFALKANAQQSYEGKYFDVQTPNATWLVQPTDVEYDGEAINLIKLNGEAFEAHFMMISIKGMEDLESFLESQKEVENMKSPTDIVATEFMGEDALAFSFVMNLEGNDYPGDGYAIYVDGVLYYFMLYANETQGNYDDCEAIMRSFAVK